MSTRAKQTADILGSWNITNYLVYYGGFLGHRLFELHGNFCFYSNSTRPLIRLYCIYPIQYYTKLYCTLTLLFHFTGRVRLKEWNMEVEAMVSFWVHRIFLPSSASQAFEHEDKKIIPGIRCQCGTASTYETEDKKVKLKKTQVFLKVFFFPNIDPNRKQDVFSSVIISKSCNPGNELLCGWNNFIILRVWTRFYITWNTQNYICLRQDQGNVLSL